MNIYQKSNPKFRVLGNSGSSPNFQAFFPGADHATCQGDVSFPLNLRNKSCSSVLNQSFFNLIKLMKKISTFIIDE